MELSNLIGLIKKRPYMYLDDKNILNLDTFIRAYLHGKEVSHNVSEWEEKFIAHFHIWVKNYYVGPLDTGWANTILYFEGSQSAAFNKFFDIYQEWLDEYCFTGSKS